MTPLHTAARMALDALEKIYDATPIDQTRYDLCNALREALAAPMPEPVAWVAVADKMPPEDVPCWLYEPGIGAWIGGWSGDADGWLWHHCHGSQYMTKDGEWDAVDAEADDYSPTHWMPLPAAPGAAPPAAPAPATSADYAMGYAEGFNDACKPAPVVREPLSQHRVNELCAQLTMEPYQVRAIEKAHGIGGGNG